MKFKIFQDNDEIEFMNIKRLIEYAKTIKKVNPDCPRRADPKKLEEAIMIIRWAGEDVQIVSDGDYYVNIARDHLGSACRDNTRDELINIGKDLESGELYDI